VPPPIWTCRRRKLLLLLLAQGGMAFSKPSGRTPSAISSNVTMLFQLTHSLTGHGASWRCVVVTVTAPTATATGGE